MNRRNFIRNAGAFCAMTGIDFSPADSMFSSGRKIRIDFAKAAVEKEPLIKPFGFKGGYLTELWQTAARLRSGNGTEAVGLGTQSVLWSDASVFSQHTEAEGNMLMYSMTQKALELLNGRLFTDPISALESIIDEVYHYGQQISRRQDLRKTFALNALVPVDNALWILYARENRLTSFDSMIPGAYKKTLSHRHRHLAYIPLVSYNVNVEELKKNIREEGSFFIKIKLGHPGTQQEMLEKDQAALSEIHKAIGNIITPHTESGKLLYYFDANGRYESKELLQRYLDHAKKIGAFGQIALVEEPFPEHVETDVSDLGVRISADESAHTDHDALKRIQMGYSAIALKAIAKTMSMTMKVAAVAHRHNVPCFCADLTVNPILVEWNKNIAARLPPLPGLKAGLLETNGRQNYRRWEELCSYSPSNGEAWTEVHDGVFTLDRRYYHESGGILKKSVHYEQLFEA